MSSSTTIASSAKATTIPSTTAPTAITAPTTTTSSTPSPPLQPTQRAPVAPATGPSHDDATTGISAQMATMTMAPSPPPPGNQIRHNVIMGPRGIKRRLGPGSSPQVLFDSEYVRPADRRRLEADSKNLEDGDAGSVEDKVPHDKEQLPKVHGETQGGAKNEENISNDSQGIKSDDQSQIPPIPPSGNPTGSPTRPNEPSPNPTPTTHAPPPRPTGPPDPETDATGFTQIRELLHLILETRAVTARPAPVPQVTFTIPGLIGFIQETATLSLACLYYAVKFLHCLNIASRIPAISTYNPTHAQSLLDVVRGEIIPLYRTIHALPRTWDYPPYDGSPIAVTDATTGTTTTNTGPGPSSSAFASTKPSMTDISTLYQQWRAHEVTFLTHMRSYYFTGSPPTLQLAQAVIEPPLYFFQQAQLHTYTILFTEHIHSHRKLQAHFLERERRLQAQHQAEIQAVEERMRREMAELQGRCEEAVRKVGEERDGWVVQAAVEKRDLSDWYVRTMGVWNEEMGVELGRLRGEVGGLKAEVERLSRENEVLKEGGGMERGPRKRVMRGE